MSRVLPILFNTEMVRAILDGRKKVTRRLVKNLEIEENNGLVSLYEKNEYDAFCISPMEYAKRAMVGYCQFQPGDILYVRETWCKNPNYDEYYFKTRPFGIAPYGLKWKPSLHMPKEAARIFLKVKDVRVERLQDITEEQAEEEGFQFTPPCLSRVSEDSYCDLDGPCTSKVKYCDMSAGELFGKVLWDSTIKKSDLGKYGWDANPWVYVIEFERCEKPKEVNHGRSQ